MKRADTAALIIASVIVVLLGVGGGLLLYKRNTILKTATAQGETTVTLTTLDDTSTLPPKPATVPAKQPTPQVPKQPKGSDFGYVTKVDGSGKNLWLKWDQAELLTGNEADLFAKKNGQIMATEAYYIANDTHKTKSYDISSKAVIVVYESDGTSSTMSPGEYIQDWKASGPSRKRPWWLFVHDGVVTRMEQVVLPSSTGR